MRKKIASVLKSDIIKVSSSTSISTAIKLAASFIISKVLAVFVGPAGIAMLGQLTNLATIFQSLSTGGIQIGVTKYVSEYADDKKQQDEYVNNAFKITFYCSVISSLLVIIFYKAIGHFFFGTNNYNSIILLLGATLVLFSFNSLIVSIVNGYKEFRLFVVLNIIASIVSLIITTYLVYSWGIYGAFLAFIIGPAIVFFITWVYVRKKPWLSFRFIKIPINKLVLKKLSRFSLMAINNALVGASALMIIRTFITSKMSIDTAGIWDGMNKLSAAWMLLFTSSIQVYYLPTLSYIKDKKQLWREILKTQKMILPLIFLLFVIVFLFRGLIIEILFTKEFYEMKSVFAYQLIGDLIKIASWIFSYTMYAKAMTKHLILTDNIFTIFYISISYFLMEYMGYGLSAVYIGYIINNVIYLLFMYILIKRYTNTANA